MAWTVLKALGLEFELNKINLMTGEQQKPEYLAINPRGKVPALKDGDYVIAERYFIANIFYSCSLIIL